MPNLMTVAAVPELSAASRIGFAALLGREATIAGLGALAGAVVGGGIGSRLAMRLVALLNPDATGRITENGNRIGQITLGGSLFLFVFVSFAVTFLVAPILFGYARLLPSGTLARGLTLGVVLLLAFGSQVISAQNIDFRLAGSALFNIALFATLFMLVGLVAAATAAVLRRGLPRPTASRLSAGVYIGVVSVGIPIVLGPVIGSFFVVGAAPLVVLTYVASIVFGVARLAWPGEATALVGRLLLVAIAFAGGVQLIDAIGGIMERAA